MMNKLSSSSGSGDNTSQLLEAIKDIADNIRDECDKKYALKGASLGDGSSGGNYDGLEKRVTNLERDNLENKDKIDSAFTRIDANQKGVHKNAEDIKKLQRAMEELKEKMDILADSDKDVKMPEIVIPSGKDGSELTGQQLTEAVQPLFAIIKQIELKLSTKAENKALQDTNDELREYIENRLRSLSPAPTAPTDASSLLNKNPSSISTLQKSDVSKDDRDRWDAAASNVKMLKDLIDGLRKDFSNLDVNSLKAQLSTVAQKVNSCVQKSAFDALLEEMRKAKEDIKENKYEIQQLADKLDRLIDNVVMKGQSPTIDEFRNLKNKVESCENQIAMLKKLISQINTAIKNIPKDGNMKQDVGSNFETNGDLEDELKKLRQDLDDYKKNNDTRLGGIQRELDDKASKQDLLDLEQRLLDKLQELMNSLAGLFADKEGTRKRLNALEKNIKNLYDLLMAQINGKNNNEEDDAMFTKKPYGPVTCASCEKDIVNLQGKQADYLAWKRLPFREPSERIARYGQGFSKILSMMKPEQ